MICPICGNENMYNKSYYDEYGLEEQCTRCEECGKFVDHWAFGRQVIIIKDKHWDFTDHGYMNDEDMKASEKAWSEIGLELDKCRHYDGSYSV